jgi:hypothetical protein
MIPLKQSIHHWYKLKNSTKKRRIAINKGIQYEKIKRKLTYKKASLSKKRRLNVLRIYHKKYCNIITKDMKYLDKKYKLGKTHNICNK